MFFKLRCHYCGARSSHPKGTYNFDCTACDAPNFYDIHGAVLDPPTPVAAAPSTFQGTYSSFTREPSREAPQQDSSVFCSRCRKNQQIYTEALSNYLPDEDHPRYAEFEAGLPAAKAKLEKEYPLVCTKCAKKAQHTIHKADYYGKSQQIGRMAMETRKNRGGSPVGCRDDWGKYSIRTFLGLIGMIVYASLLAQIAWHAYGIFVALSTETLLFEMDDFALDPTFEGCSWQMKALRFDKSCFELFATLMPKALLASLCLLWYNPGLKQWYHHTWRMEEVNGQVEHFRIQAVLIIARTYAWFTLRNDAAFSKHQLLASHGFTIVFSIVCQWLSSRMISSRRWTLKGKIMPKPEFDDVFTATAGPADESYDRQPSSVPPQLRPFARDNKAFPIANLAPRRGYSKLDLLSMPPPSPPDSQSPQFSDDEDAMDIDSATYATNRTTTSSFIPGTTRTQPNPSGWSAMRSTLFDIDENHRTALEKKAESARRGFKPAPIVQDPSPFRGRLPPAPMSMGKRLRNPPQHVIDERIPLSQRANFMELMRPGKGSEGVFNVAVAAPTKTAVPSYADPFANDDDFSPVKQRARHSDFNAEFLPKTRKGEAMELRPAQFTLRSDLNNATGLEDLFGGGSFSIDDPDARRTAGGRGAGSGSRIMLAKSLLVVCVVGIAVGVYSKAEGMYSMAAVKTAVFTWAEETWEWIRLYRNHDNDAYSG